MSKDDLIFLGHINDAISQIDEYLHNITYSKFIKKKIIQDAVIRQLSIVGEATKNISNKFKENNSNIFWKDITGMRDILVHDYLGVDLDEVWNTITHDLPILKKEI